MPNTSRERALEAALLSLYHEWAGLPIAQGKKRRWYANYIRQMFTPGCKRYRGGIETVKHVIRNPTSGPGRLNAHPDLTVESRVVLSGKWNDLFDDADKLRAEQNLATISKRARSIPF
jgi:hypothetical protein